MRMRGVSGGIRFKFILLIIGMGSLEGYTVPVMTISSESFGSTLEGRDAQLWIIENSHGLRLEISDWGARIVSVVQPDREGRGAPVCLGLPDAGAYLKAGAYIGASCGRFANRIARGRFTLNGRGYELARNDGANHLHGGDRGFDRRLWRGEPYSEGDRSGVVMHLTSPDGEEGYPGTLKVQADYGLDESGRLFMGFRAETDAPTIVNLTNHAYWNPAGAPSPGEGAPKGGGAGGGAGEGGSAGGGAAVRGIGGVELRLWASRYLPVDDTAIPLGAAADTAGTPFDFRSAKRIDRDMDAVPGGYDHCMVIDGDPGDLRIAAEALDPASGRKFTLFTDRPGVQFYSGNKLGGGGSPFPRYAGFCLEPEAFPDSPNRPDFPSAALNPGEVYHHRSIVRFDTVPGG